MACENCKKTKLNSCEECDFTVNTDCVEFTGDKLCVEEGIVRSGSSRTLTSVIEALDDLCDCAERPSKIVDGDYQIILEDACKVLLLDGELSSDPENVTYTITLPDSGNGDALNFINKTLIFKDISEQNDPSGLVLWNFDQSIKYDWENNLSTTSFETLSHSLHKVVWLQFLKHPDSTYKWTAVSPNSIDYSGDITDLQDQIDDISGVVSDLEIGTSTPVYIEYDDVDLLNSWETQAGFPVRAYKLGSEIRLTGTVKNGDNIEPCLQLPVGYRPPINLIFPAVTNVYISGGQAQCGQIFVDTSGNVTIQLFDTGSGASTAALGYVHLSVISFFNV